jgi:hypothetical protein
MDGYRDFNAFAIEPSRHFSLKNSQLRYHQYDQSVRISSMEEINGPP